MICASPLLLIFQNYIQLYNGYLPIVHLWHAAQPGKHDAQRQTAELLEQLSVIPASERIANLIAQNFASGNTHP